MIHTSQSLRSKDTKFENYHYQLQDGEQYQLTEAEIGWLNFIRGKYCIADHLDANIKDGIYTVDIEDMSIALENDGVFPKAVILSDDTVLQAIFFYSSQEQDRSEEIF